MMFWAGVELREMREEGTFEFYFEDRIGKIQLGNTHEAKGGITV